MRLPTARHHAFLAGFLVSAALGCAGTASRSGAAPSAAAARAWNDTTTPPCDSAAFLARAVPFTRTVMLQLRAPARGQALPRPYADSALARLRLTLVVPSPLTLPVFSGSGVAPDDTLPGADSSWVHPDFGVGLRITVSPQGLVRRVARLGSSYDSALDSAVINAVDRALNGGAAPPLPPTPPELRGDSLRIDLELDTEPVRGAAARIEHAKELARGEVLEAPLTRVQLPHFRGARMVAPRRVRQPFPRYPQEMRTQGIEGEAWLRGVVGVDGRLLPSSVVITRATRLEFADAVRVVAPGMLYDPTRIAGCAVPTYIEQPFTFAISR